MNVTMSTELTQIARPEDATPGESSIISAACQPGEWDPENPGDCFPRCIAWLLGDDPAASDVPRPVAAEVEVVEGDIGATGLKVGYYIRLGAWLHARGYQAIDIHEKSPSCELGWTSFHWDLETEKRPLMIATGPRVGDGLGHCVVMAGFPGQDGSSVVCNPSESKIEKVTAVTFIFPIQAERLGES